MLKFTNFTSYNEVPSRILPEFMNGNIKIIINRNNTEHKQALFRFVIDIDAVFQASTPLDSFSITLLFFLGEC